MTERDEIFRTALHYDSGETCVSGGTAVNVLRPRCKSACGNIAALPTRTADANFVARAKRAGRWTEILPRYRTRRAGPQFETRHQTAYPRPGARCKFPGSRPCLAYRAGNRRCTAFLLTGPKPGLFFKGPEFLPVDLRPAAPSRRRTRGRFVACWNSWDAARHFCATARHKATE